MTEIKVWHIIAIGISIGVIREIILSWYEYFYKPINPQPTISDWILAFIILVVLSISVIILYYSLNKTILTIKD